MRNRVLLVIDPCSMKPEFEAYNFFSRAVGVMNASPFSQLSHVEFSLPFLTERPLHDTISQHVSGVICMGSRMNTTENNPLMLRLIEDLRSLIFEHNIPFFGICFSHQLLAHMFGGTIDFVKNRDHLPQRKHHAFRRTNVVHPKLRMLLARVSEDDFIQGHGEAALLAGLYKKSMEFGRTEWESIQSGADPRFKGFHDFLTHHTKDHFISQGRHEQEVHAIGSTLLLAGSSDECPIDALIHPEKPIWSVQTHPETPHFDGDGHMMLRNFIQLCALAG